MKSIILTVAVAVLGLVSCKKEVIAPVVLSQTELIQGDWNNNTISINEPTSIGEPADYPNAIIEGNTWTYAGLEARTFSIVNDVITWAGAGNANVVSISSCQIILTDTLANGNVQVLKMNR